MGLEETGYVSSGFSCAVGDPSTCLLHGEVQWAAGEQSLEFWWR